MAIASETRSRHHNDRLRVARFDHQITRLDPHDRLLTLRIETVQLANS